MLFGWRSAVTRPAVSLAAPQAGDHHYHYGDSPVGLGRLTWIRSSVISPFYQQYLPCRVSTACVNVQIPLRSHLVIILYEYVKRYPARQQGPTRALRGDCRDEKCSRCLFELNPGLQQSSMCQTGSVFTLGDSGEELVKETSQPKGFRIQDFCS